MYLSTTGIRAPTGLPIGFCIQIKPAGASWQLIPSHVT
jgi:hypothetical protein